MVQDKGSKTKYKKKKKKSKFWRFLGIYSVILIVVIAAALIWVYGLLKDYESGMPDVAMQEIIDEKFSADSIDALVYDGSAGLSRYENQDYAAAYMKEAVSGKTVTFARKSGEYTGASPVYTIKSDDRNIAKVSLKEIGKNGHGFSVWGIDNITIGVSSDNNPVTITAPAKAVVTINGIRAEDDIVKEKNVPVEKTKNVSEYIELPVNTIYSIDDLMSEPDIKAELDGVQLEVQKADGAGGAYTVLYPSDEELLASQSDYIKNINIEYGKYIINRGSLSRLKSYMTGNAERYVSDIPAVWAYLWGKTYTYEFKTNEISNFVKYSDDCFSCDVHFDLYVEWNTGNKTYDTNMSYIFIKQDDKWYLADFAIN